MGLIHTVSKILKRLYFVIVAPDHVVLYNKRNMYFSKDDNRAVDLFWTGGDVNPLSLIIWKKLLSSQCWSHVIDVGANYGEMLLNSDFPENSIIVGFEPNPIVAALLTRSIREAKMDVQVCQAAVGSADGSIELCIDQQWSGKTGVIRENTTGIFKKLIVPLTTLTAC